MKKINKKGEMTSKQIVTLIILITSFVVLLILFFRLDLGRVTDSEICHNSVVLSAAGKSLVSELDCKTAYVCISGGEECEGIVPTETAKINMKKEEKIVKEEIMQVLADEMVDCWWMFGEGELIYAPNADGYHCALCNVVKFDSSIQEKFPELTYAEFYNYLSIIEKTENKNYLEYLYGTYNLEMVKEKNKKINIDTDKISTAEKFVVLTGIDPRIVLVDKVIFPWLVKYDQIKTKTKCEVFDITQA